MQLAHAALPRFELDPKRILATSGAIALHIGVLMLLLMPAQPPNSVETETVTQVQFIDPPIKPIPLLPPKPLPPTPKPVAQVAPAPVLDPPPVNIDAPPSLVDTAAVEVPVEANTFETQPQQSFFTQLATVAAPAPPYPRNAVARRLQGTVTLRIHVSATGEPLEVSVENSSGSPLLDEAAQKFVKARWRFVPAQQNGQATEAWALVPIEFVLH